MNTLTLTGANAITLTVNPYAQQQKKDALDLARTITTVTTTAEQADCIAAASLAKGLVKGMESSREDVKKPVLDWGRKIDAEAKAYSKELAAEVLRLEMLAGDFQRKENEKAAILRREEETRQAKERQQAEDDRQRELRFVADKDSAYDAERRADLERIANATTDEEREAARKLADDNAEARAEEARINQRAIEDAREQREEEARQRATAMQVIVPPKASGASVRVAYDYEVIDIRQLYAHRPELVALEPKRAMILAAICCGQAIPGLRIHEVTKLHSKAS